MPLAAWHPGIDQRQLDIVQGIGTGQQVEGLEDEADLAVAQGGQPGVGQVRDQVAVQPVLAAVRAVQATDDVHQRRLA
jgi:hypothetical protein